MRVLHFYKTSILDSQRGVDHFIDTLCKSTSTQGIKNDFLTLSKSPPQKNAIKIHGYTIHQAKQDLFVASTGFSLSAFGKLKKLARQADVIHYHFPNPFADILHFACGIKKPTLVTYHSDIIRQKNLLRLYRPLKQRFLQSIDHIVATSPNYLASSDVLQDYTGKVSVIPIGLDISSYPKVNNERLDYWRRRLTHPFFSFLGTMRYYKGLHIALDAVSGTDIRLAIAGINGIEAPRLLGLLC